MAMIRVAPVKVQVRTDWLSGSPKEITWGEDRLQVTRLVAVRDERSAYPAITGPRTLFEVDTPGARPARHSPPDHAANGTFGLVVAGLGVCGRARGTHGTHRLASRWMPVSTIGPWIPSRASAT